MNIFVLSRDPIRAAGYACDRHVVKMVVETAQLLCTAFTQNAPYRASKAQRAHPCALWTRASQANYEWLIAYGRALAAEYTRRYGRTHASLSVIEWCAAHIINLTFPRKDLTPFVQTMPVELHDPDPVLAYRRFYRRDKARFATWKAPAHPPHWWNS